MLLQWRTVNISLSSNCAFFYDALLDLQTNIEFPDKYLKFIFLVLCKKLFRIWQFEYLNVSNCNRIGTKLRDFFSSDYQISAHGWLAALERQSLQNLHLFWAAIVVAEAGKRHIRGVFVRQCHHEVFQILGICNEDIFWSKYSINWLLDVINNWFVNSDNK